MVREMVHGTRSGVASLQMCFLSVDNSHVTSLGLKVLWSNENAIRFGTWNADVSVN
jgi:hypothetical protein